MKNKVSIIKCPDYNRDEVRSAVEKALNLIGINLSKVNKVLLKPNVLGPFEPERFATTHPVFISAICSIINPEATILICDSSGTEIENYTTEALKVTGIKKIETEFENVKVLSFNSMELEKIESSSEHLDGLYIPKILKEVDLVINLPKLKTHTLMTFTGAVKNLFGCLPGGAKGKMHQKCQHTDDFGKMLLDLHDIVKPELNILDGIWGMDGNGPIMGNSKNFGIVAVSKNAMALDIAVSRIIGFENEDIPTIKISKQRYEDLNDITVLGINDLKMECKKPISTKGLSNRLPKSLQKYLCGFDVLINNDKCKDCKICYRSCPVNAIMETSKGLKIDKDKCIDCYCCHELCPHGAVEFKEKILRRIAIKIKNTILRGAP